MCCSAQTRNEVSYCVGGDADMALAMFWPWLWGLVLSFRWTSRDQCPRGTGWGSVSVVCPLSSGPLNITYFRHPYRVPLGPTVPACTTHSNHCRSRKSIHGHIPMYNFFQVYIRCFLQVLGRSYFSTGTARQNKFIYWRAIQAL